MYKYLLFDLDDTILDFKANEKRSLKELFTKYNIEITDELINTYTKINHELWDLYAKGEVSMSEVLNTRFAKTMEKFGKVVDGAEYEKQYRINLGEGSELMDDAISVLDNLSQNYTLYVVTNGVTKTQINRLNKAGISHYFKKIYTSETIGYPKPHREFFDYVIEDLKLDVKDALVIGDSLNNDINGALNVGIDACWMSNGKTNDTLIKPTYTINNLKELIDILKKL